MKAVTLLLVIFILGVGGYLALQAWPPFQSNSPKRITLISSKNCWLNESICTAEHESVQLSLELAPHPVPLMKPVQVTMQLKAVNNLESASLKIEGENIFPKEGTLLKFNGGYFKEIKLVEKINLQDL